jgi:hypothetical protein
MEMIATAATGTSLGKALTLSGTANTKAAWTELNNSTSNPYGGFVVEFANNVNTEATSCLVDIAFGTTIVVPNILCFSDFINYASSLIYFPISIPSGTQVQARIQQRALTGAPAMMMWGVPFDPLMPASLGRVTTYGAATGDSGGVNIDCGASSNTKVRTQIVASTTNPMKHMVVCIGDAGITGRATARFLFDIEVGSSHEIIFGNVMLRGDGSESVGPTHFQFPVNLPAGTEININAQCSTTTDNTRDFDVVILGID